LTNNGKMISVSRRITATLRYTCVVTVGLISQVASPIKLYHTQTGFCFPDRSCCWQQRLSMFRRVIVEPLLQTQW